MKMHKGESSQALAIDAGRVSPSSETKRIEQPFPIAVSFGQELLRLVARQARRVPIPVFLSTGVIAALAINRVPILMVSAWMVLVLTVLVIRWTVLGRLPTLTHIPERNRLRIVVGLAAMSGITHGLSLGFFPFLPELGRSLQSMIFVALCAGAVSTTAGYTPVFLAYILPMLVPLTALWALSPGSSEVGWVERSTSAWIAMSGVFTIALANEALRLFRESVAARQQQVELNRQLHAALEQAETASRAKTRFLASASHDLRQPIHTLSLFGAALTMRPLDYASREIAQHMNTALQMLASQLDALLDISKLDARVVRVNPTLIKLRSMLERVCKEFGPEAEAKGLEITLECPEDSFIETDQLLFERIVRNLLDNAIKYTDAGGVTLRVTREEKTFSIAVTDSGRGIPEAERARIFEEFYQIDNPERDRTKGLGLGLAIVRRLADLLEIKLDMTSTLGTGTCFCLTIPASVGAATAAIRASVSHETPASLHVLVVDDEVGIRVGMKTLLEGMGCRATLADGTEQALAAAQTERPDIVLSDLRLRGADNGIEAIGALRRLYPDLSAILISGDIAPERLREAEDAGIPLLHKPVPIETLKQAIAKAGRR
jgi:signal transduction histidine kinase/CheY-like chemotaxis protein